MNQMVYSEKPLKVSDFEHMSGQKLMTTLMGLTKSELFVFAEKLGIHLNQLEDSAPTEKVRYTLVESIRSICMMRYNTGEDKLEIDSLRNMQPSIAESVLRKMTFIELKHWMVFNGLVFPVGSSKDELLFIVRKRLGVTSKLRKSVSPVKICSVDRTELISKVSKGLPLLTVNEGKMYGIYLLNTDNTVVELGADNNEILTGWKDHCISPVNFHNLSKRLNCQYDNETFSHICRAWVENYLDSDWTKLHTYLPKE